MVLPAALANAADLAQGLAGSITLGCGQFCTSPGVVVVPLGEAGDNFVTLLAEALKASRQRRLGLYQLAWAQN